MNALRTIFEDPTLVGIIAAVALWSFIIGSVFGILEGRQLGRRRRRPDRAVPRHIFDSRDFDGFR